MNYYLKGFKPTGPSTISRGEWLIDPVKGVVIFKLYLEKPDDSGLAIQPLDSTG